jgi:hypothetical protein
MGILGLHKMLRDKDMMRKTHMARFKGKRVAADGYSYVPSLHPSFPRYIVTSSHRKRLVGLVGRHMCEYSQSLASYWSHVRNISSPWLPIGQTFAPSTEICGLTSQGRVRTIFSFPAGPQFIVLFSGTVL